MKRKSETITPQEAKNQFIAEKKAQGLVPRSISGYEVDITNLIKGINTLDELDILYITNLINAMLETKKPVTVNHYLRAYRAFLYWCMDNHYIDYYKIKLVREQEPPLKIYSEDDINKLLERPTHKDSFTVWRTWACVAFALGTGARAGTLLNMKVTDIDLKLKEATYRHTKNKKSAVVPLCDNLVKVLTLYINEFDLTDYLFPNDDNEQLLGNGLKMAFQRYCNKRDVEYKSFHSLRHTYAKQFIINGGNPFQLQRMLDHQSLAMSQHYAHLFATDLKDVVNDFSPLAKIKDKEKITRKS